MYRHHPQTAKVRRLVADGAIGRLCAVKTTFTFPLQDLSDVRALPELDGGALMDVGCYCVSGIRLLAGDPEHVRGEQVTGTTGIDMAFHGTLRCADDVVGQFEASFRSPQRQSLEVVGEDGVLVVEAPWRVDWGGGVTLRADESTEVVEVEIRRLVHARAREPRRRDRGARRRSSAVTTPWGRRARSTRSTARPRAARPSRSTPPDELGRPRRRSAPDPPVALPEGRAEEAEEVAARRRRRRPSSAPSALGKRARRAPGTPPAPSAPRSRGRV